MTELICITCPKGCHLSVDEKNDYAVTGNSCPRGVEYGKSELLHPVRVVTSTVRIQGAVIPRLPVKTDGPLPRSLVREAVRMLDAVEISSPVCCGDVVLPDIGGTGVNFVASRDM